MKQASAIANINIALLKYWGKFDDINVLPTTTSISFVLDRFYTITTISVLPNLKQDILIINDQLADLDDHQKVSSFLDRFDRHDYVQVVSKNHVPMKAGLASSASAFASIATAAREVFKTHWTLSELASITRFGSGSAARSIFDGFVKWSAYSDRIEQIHAPMLDIGMFVVVVDANPKKISSRQAMAITKQTSWNYNVWVDNSVQQALDMEHAIMNQDFHLIGQLSQQNALGMHTTMIAANPPIIYLNPDSLRIIHELLHLQSQGVALYFTMDAGPNIKILVQDKEKEVIETLLHQFIHPSKLMYSKPGKKARIIHE
jgi:diphosphomevalonate decarboxylase